LKKILHRGANVTAEKLRAKRTAAGIPGHAVCRVAGISRAKLSDIERGHASSAPEELQSIGAAIDQIIQARVRVRQLAAEEGLLLVGIQF